MFRSAALHVLDRSARPLGVSIVMPCLNEAISLPHCIANAQEALARIEATHGLAGEIVIADNGSTDGSQALAEALGARVVPVARKGYGAAIIGGCEGAFGEHVLIGDADGSYDFTDGVAMIGRLIGGADLCVGSRFQGGIAAGAMPWKNRHIGNPALTGLLNLFFRAGIDDAHCGLRAMRRDAFLNLGLDSDGMEFASEMIVKASLHRLAIAETPATLSRDLRERAPHLRPWRDGWRHLRFLLMLSPTWTFGVPGVAAMAGSVAVLLVSLLHMTGLLTSESWFGTSWAIVAGFLFTTGYSAALTALAMHLHSVREGARRPGPALGRAARILTLETMLCAGGVLVLAGLTLFAGVAYRWSAHDFAALPSVLPLVAAAVIGTAGVQTIFGAFMLAMIGANQSRFLDCRPVGDIA